MVHKTETYDKKIVSPNPENSKHLNKKTPKKALLVAGQDSNMRPPSSKHNELFILSPKH